MNRASQTVFHLCAAPLLCIGLSMLLRCAPTQNEDITAELTLVSPRNGEVFTVGDTLLIEWHYNPDSASAPIEINYSNDSGLTWLSVATANIEKGGYEWEIPEDLRGVSTASAYGYIRINEYERENYRLAAVSIQP